MTCDICQQPVPQPEGVGRPRKRHEGECTREAKRRRIEARRIADAIEDPDYLAEEVARLRRRLKEAKARLKAVRVQAAQRNVTTGRPAAFPSNFGGER